MPRFVAPYCSECKSSALKCRLIVFESRIFCSPTCLAPFHARFIAELEMMKEATHEVLLREAERSEPTECLACQRRPQLV